MTEDSHYTEKKKNSWHHYLKRLDSRLKVALVFTLFLVIYTLYSFFYDNIESTDNALVRCEKIDIISEIPGILHETYVSDNTYYQEGDLLAKIDDRVIVSRERQAQSELHLAKAILRSTQANKLLVEIIKKSDGVIKHATLDASTFQKESVSNQISELQSKLFAAQDTQHQAKLNLEREEKLVKNKLLSKSQLDNTRLKYKLALAESASLKSKLKSIEFLEKVRYAEIVQAKEHYINSSDISTIKLEQAKAQTLEALAKVNLAKEKLQHSRIMLEKTNLVAKRSGYVTNIRIYKGDFVGIGQPIASIISCGHNAWIEANFKETQITKMKKGQQAKFRVDTYSDKVITGTVEGLSYGSGAIFSIFPPENAVGNYTKVVQRFPVKIRIDDPEALNYRAGMSVSVKVYTDDKL